MIRKKQVVTRDRAEKTKADFAHVEMPVARRSVKRRLEHPILKIGPCSIREQDLQDQTVTESLISVYREYVKHKQSKKGGQTAVEDLVLIYCPLFIL